MHIHYQVGFCDRIINKIGGTIFLGVCRSLLSSGTYRTFKRNCLSYFKKKFYTQFRHSHTRLFCSLLWNNSVWRISHWLTPFSILFVSVCFRTFIFSFLIKGGKPTPLVPFILAFVFCLLNGYVQGGHLLKYADLSAGSDVRFYAGEYIVYPKFLCCFLFLFLVGLFID